MNSAATKTKNRQIVLLTLFAMTLVVAGHCDITPDYKQLWIFKWVYSFHMPLFFFISGFLFALTTPGEKLKTTTILSFIKKKAIRLLIPFLFINTTIFIIKSALIRDSSMMQHPIELTWNSFIDSTLFNPIGFMWFLPALFVIFMISFPIRKALNIHLDKRSLYLIVITILFFTLDTVIQLKISFMQLSKAIYYISFFFIGILYFDNKNIIDQFLKKYCIIIAPLFLILSISLQFKGILAALFVVFSVTLSLVLEKKCPESFVKASTLCYTVYLFSYFPQMLIRGPIAHHFSMVNQYAFSVLSFISGLLIPIIIGILYLQLKRQNKLIERCGILIGI